MPKDAKTRTSTARKAKAKAVAEGQRKIQSRIDAKDAAKTGKAKTDEAPPQTGARDYPVPPFPKQHLKKPGKERDLKLKPMFEAPYWTGSGKLEGRAAIITGGDSGIGRAVAVLFAREGCDVVIGHLDEAEDADETHRAVVAEGRRCEIVQGDAADPLFSQALVQTALDVFGRLDVVVPNAAFQEHVETIDHLEADHFDRTLKTNLYGYFHLVKAAVPHLKPGAAIVMTGSITGIDGSKHLLDYAMTKGGIHAFARSLSSDLIRRGVRVNVVAPGPVWTPLNPADKDADKASMFGSDSVMQRPGQPEEIAPAYVFLASPQMSSFITGEVLPVIGGYDN